MGCARRYRKRPSFPSISIFRVPLETGGSVSLLRAHGRLSSTATKKFRYMREAHDPFPLTPALSLGERENRRQSVGESETAGVFESRTSLHPLPEGEGRGEGGTETLDRPQASM